MPFSETERAALLAIKGVGPKVIERLEQLGVCSLDALAAREATDLCGEIAARLGSSCWKNSPQSRAAITAAVGFARRRRSA